MKVWFMTPGLTPTSDTSRRTARTVARRTPSAWAARLALATVALALLLGAAPAAAQCVPIGVPPAPGGAATTFAVEGKITAYDRLARTLTANGMTFTLPQALLVATNGLNLPGNITLDALTDPALEASRSIIGGTTIASGNITTTATPAGNCLAFTATSVFVELAENVLIGVMHDIDVAAGSFRINGALVRMNADPRFPSQLTDIGGNPIPFGALAGYEGSAVAAEGYYDVATNTLMATLAETEVVPLTPGADGVAISRAQMRAAATELRVEGQAVANSAGQLATTVSVFSGDLNAAGTACAGALLATVNVTAVDGTFSFRQRRTALVRNVCVQSPLGGVATRAVTVR